MSSQTALIQLSLVDFTPQRDIFTTDILPGILALLDPASVTTQILPVAETLDGLEAGLSAEPGAWRIVFYDRAEQAVEDALLAGTLPRSALAKWEQKMQVLLGFHRKHRRSVLLVDRATVWRTPHLFTRGLSTYLDIAAPKASAPQSTPGASASVENIIAAQTVAQSLQAKRLNGELDASSLPILADRENHHCDVDAAFQSYVAEKTHVDEAQTADLKAENELLLFQLGTLQKELEDYSRRWSTQVHQTSDLEGQIQILRENTAQADKTHLSAQEDLDRQHKQHKASAKNAKAENELLLMQLGTVQEELESYFLEAKQLRTACREYEEQLSTLGEQSSAAVQDVERKLQTARNTLNDTENKMQKVAGHLHTTEGSLKETEGSLKETEDSLKETEDSLKEREQNLEQAQHNVAQLEDQLHQREDELHHFLQSTSWRITGPLRRIKDRLSRPKDQEH